MSRQHRDIKIENYPSVSSHITWTESDNFPIIIRGYAIDNRTGIRKDFSTERKRSVMSDKDLEIKIQYLHKAISDDVTRHMHKAVAKVLAKPNTETALDRAFAELKRSTDPVSSDWGEDYTRNRLSYFRRNILPFLKSVNLDEWNTETREDLLKKITEKILKNGNAAGHEAVAKETAEKSLYASNIIYQRMRDFDHTLPAISLAPHSTGRRSISHEQMKSIPRKIRRRFVQKLEKFIEKDPRLALSIIIMYGSGLRTAEAAAVWIDVISRGEEISTLLVRYQVKEGVRSKILKTKNAYRKIPLSYWEITMVDRCLSKLSDDPDDVKNWVCDTRTLSSTIKKMLIDAGLTEEYFAIAEQAMRAKPDFDDSGREIFDITAYILRRDFASRCRNICGLTALEIDYLLGHEIKIARKKREDFRHIESQKRLAQKLERYVHNSVYSKHPGASPYKIEHSTDLTFIPYDVIRLRNTSNEKLNIKLDIESVVNRDSIIVIVPSNSQTASTIRYIPTHCIRTKEPIIGKSYLKEDGTIEDL